MTSDSRTIEVYNQQAADYAKFTSNAKSDPALIRFIARLPSAASVLDLGCGPGDHAAAMRDAGLEVTATDASKAMVELARKHEGIVVRHASFEDLDETDSYHGVWANFSLLHAGKKEFPKHLKRIFASLKQGGILHLAMKTGADNARDKLGRHYTYYFSESLRNLLEDAGFEVMDEVTGEALGLAGDVEPWIILTARCGPSK